MLNFGLIEITSRSQGRETMDIKLEIVCTVALMCAACLYCVAELGYNGQMILASLIWR